MTAWTPETPRPWLPDAVYAQLEDALAFRLPEFERRWIDTGVWRAVIDREVQLHDGAEMSELLTTLEQSAKAFEAASRKVLELAMAPYWLLYLGGDEALRSSIKRCEIHTSAHLLYIAAAVGTVRRGATAMLEGKKKGQGARKRYERDLMCRYIAKALQSAGGWHSGSCDAKAVRRFAQALLPHIPAQIAHKSHRAFADALCKAFTQMD